MGVTLERVQNKFACIIGELCSEPVVLSQFAIWLDLRLAEYKAKGAISLDCSGDHPDPTWLNGHRLPGERTLGRSSPGTRRNSPSQKQSVLQRRSFSSPSANFSNSRVPVLHPSDENLAFGNSPHDRLSPDLVVIKSEHGEGIADPDSLYPITMVRNELSSNQTRKRPAETLTREQSSPLKIKRVAGNLSESDLDLTSNQSLLSIISTEGQGQISAGADSELNQTDVDFSIIKNFTAQDEDQRGDNSALGESFSLSTAESEDVSDLGNTTDAGRTWHPADIDQTDNYNNDETDAGTFTGEISVSYPRMDGQCSISANLSQSKEKRIRTSRSYRMDRLSTMPSSGQIEGKCKDTVKAMISAAAGFERWVLIAYTNEQRKMEKIPAAELDEYLTRYFSEVTKPSGEAYTYSTFRLFQCRLDLYLRSQNYLYSITKSEEFSKSSHAFRVKLKSLHGEMLKWKSLKKSLLESM